jgi:acyl-coenzyme A synthetase/AMP-(fatty) acid ligase
MNAQGYINIVGRLKEMVIRGGENIFPREIEEFLLRHPKIADVYVLGVPDAFFGEELLAVVRPGEATEVTEQELREFSKGKISHQKIPVARCKSSSCVSKRYGLWDYKRSHKAKGQSHESRLTRKERGYDANLRTRDDAL